MYIHLTAHARGNLSPLLDDDVCRWLWSHLRDAFPDALAAILMPDHPHLVWRQPTAIAEMCDVHPNSVPRLAASCPPEWLEAAALCLGDDRLVVAPDVGRAIASRRR